MRNSTRTVGAGVVVGFLLMGLLSASCEVPDTIGPEPSWTTTTAPGEPIPDYDREAFEHWSDFNNDRCDTREEVLRRDAVEVVELDADGCVDIVTIIGPYTGQRVTGGPDIHVDHVVSLSDAWDSGAHAWDDERRETFANDPTNLLATLDSANRAKSDKGPDEWRPTVTDFGCEYASTYRDTKMTYGLTITDDQAAALADLLQEC